MKQLLQSLGDGTTTVVDVPAPRCCDGQALIRTSVSLVSTGTEKMLVEFGQGNLIQKARSQPDKVKQVLEKARTDGLGATMDAVRSKLDQPLALGYCNVGRVIEARDVDYLPGHRVVSNGKHAEVVAVPENLCARIPENVSDEEAAFTVLGAIALQGIRLVQPTLGETIVVTGLGLIGLLTVQLLRSNGCRVLGIDYDPKRLELARAFGADVVDLGSGQDPVVVASSYSRQRGVDAVIITASTKSSEPVHQAAQMCRKRGRIVLVGVVGLELSRADFFEKELTFQVSCSYGPGRYDVDYEEKGQDYPVGFVRWTEQRNFEAVLDMMSSGRLDVRPLVSHRFDISDAPQAYELITSAEASLGILLNYPEASSGTVVRTVRVSATEFTSKPDVPAVSFIGAGNYATNVLIPAFQAARAQLRVISSSTGVSGLHAARKYGFAETTTDNARILDEQDSNVVVVTTRHSSHAQYVSSALKAGKHVFVEKPLCLTMEELAEIELVYELTRRLNAPPSLMVGFNRRFAPQVMEIKRALAGVSGPKSFIMTVNAGNIPADHWTQDPKVGGGRIIGEACHFIDLLRHLADSPVAQFSSLGMDAPTNDTVTITLSFADGSLGSIHYFANGSKMYPKERLEVFAQGKILQLDNFRRLKSYGWSGVNAKKLWRQDKGQRPCVAAFLSSIKNGEAAPIPAVELFEVARVTIDLARATK